jgi:hypothetical protein
MTPLGVNTRNISLYAENMTRVVLQTALSATPRKCSNKGQMSTAAHLLQEHCLPPWILSAMERAPLSLVSTTEELLDRKVAAPA